MSKENTLDWVRRFYAGMAEGNQLPRGLHSPPPGPGGPAATVEGAMAEMHAAFRRELDGVNESLHQMMAHHNAAGLGGGQDQQGGGQGG